MVLRWGAGGGVFRDSAKPRGRPPLPDVILRLRLAVTVLSLPLGALPVQAVAGPGGRLRREDITVRGQSSPINSLSKAKHGLKDRLMVGHAQGTRYLNKPEVAHKGCWF